MRNPFKKSNQKSLDERVRDALAERGIPIVTSPPSGGNFLTYTIKGIGSSEKDDDGALTHFLTNLDHQLPDYSSVPQIGYSKNGSTKEPERLIQITAYASIPPAA